jgi:hypothetical protein
MERTNMERLTSDLVAAYASLFVQRWDAYAVQQRDGSYWRVTEPLTLHGLAAHLAGEWTLGSYLLDQESRCAFAVFDVDSTDGLVQLEMLAEELHQAGIPSLLEASRRGGHLWLHFVEAIPAWRVRAWLLPYAGALGAELYPKQDALVPGGCGSLIRLPLGRHQRSRGWYPFLARSACGNWLPVGETVAECCAWAIAHVERVAVPEIVPVSMTVEPIHRLMASHMSVESGRGAIRAWCQAQDIQEVIGRYVSLDGRGVGSCPFKDHHYRGDRRPSFQVFGGTDPHWYCYTWRRAGDLFDFLCLYHRLTPQEGWERLCAGALW